MLHRLISWVLLCPKLWFLIILSYLWFLYSLLRPFEVASAGATMVCASILGEIYLQKCGWRDPVACDKNSGLPVKTKITDDGHLEFTQGNTTCVQTKVDKYGRNIRQKDDVFPGRRIRLGVGRAKRRILFLDQTSSARIMDRDNTTKPF